MPDSLPELCLLKILASVLTFPTVEPFDWDWCETIAWLARTYSRVDVCDFTFLADG